VLRPLRAAVVVDPREAVAAGVGEGVALVAYVREILELAAAAAGMRAAQVHLLGGAAEFADFANALGPALELGDDACTDVTAPLLRARALGTPRGIAPERVLEVEELLHEAREGLALGDQRALAARHEVPRPVEVLERGARDVQPDRDGDFLLARLLDGLVDDLAQLAGRDRLRLAQPLLLVDPLPSHVLVREDAADELGALVRHGAVPHLPVELRRGEQRAPEAQQPADLGRAVVLRFRPFLDGAEAPQSVRIRLLDRGHGSADVRVHPRERAGLALDERLRLLGGTHLAATAVGLDVSHTARNLPPRTDG